MSVARGNNVKVLSIHDLTRRSTIPVYHFCTYISLSIHDLTRRSTGTGKTTRIKIYSFNSRPHKEVDRKSEVKHILELPFNSRPHKEVDRKYLQDFVNN